MAIEEDSGRAGTRTFDDASPLADFSIVAGNGMRLVAQAFGLVLILMGGYFGTQIAGDVLKAMRQPEVLDKTLAAMAKAVGAEGNVIEIADTKIVVGRLTGAIVLLLGYVVCTFIAMRLVVAGARLVFGVSRERREMYNAMREMALALRINEQPRKQ